MCKVVNGEDNFGWGAVVNFQKKANQTRVSIVIPLGPYKNIQITLSLLYYQWSIIFHSFYSSRATFLT